MSPSRSVLPAPGSTNVLVIDKAVRGREGPWRTYARMPTLRSPKDYTGPDLDIPSLTYQSWHEARFGAENWETLGNIPRDLWADYLLWVRDVTATPVRNETTLVDIAPGRRIARSDRPAQRRQHRSPPRAQDPARDWPGRHGAVVDAAADRRPPRAVPRPLRRRDRLRHLAGQDGGNRRRRRLGPRQCRHGAGARRPRGARALPPRHRPGRAALPLAHLPRLSRPPGRPRRCLALALHVPGARPARRLSSGDLRSLRPARRLPHRHGRPSQRCPRSRQPRRDRHAAGHVRRRLRHLRHRHRHGFRRPTPSCADSPKISLPGATATRPPNPNATIAWPATPTSRPISAWSRRSRAAPPGSATSTSSPSPRP